MSKYGFDYTDKYGPQRVGGQYWNAHWRDTYTVTALDREGYIRVTWSNGQMGRHLTPWYHGRDRVISQPSLDKRVAALALESIASFKRPDTIMLFRGTYTYVAAIARAKELLVTDNPIKQLLVARILERRGL